MKNFLIALSVFLGKALLSQTGFVVNTVQDFSDFTCGGTCSAWTLPGNFCYPNNSINQQDKITKYFWLSACTANADSVVFTYKYKSNGGQAVNYKIETDILNQIKSTNVKTFTTIDSGLVYGRWLIFPYITPLVFNVLMTKQGATSGNFCITISNLVVKAYCPNPLDIKESGTGILNSIWSHEDKIYFSENLKGKTYTLFDLQGRLIKKEILTANPIDVTSQKGLVFVEIDNRFFKLFLQ